MKLYPAHRAPSRALAFYPVPTRSRYDGWTPQRQAEFIGQLAATRSVCAAARWVGMARESAYRLRRRAGAASFALAWDAALGLASTNPKVTHPSLDQRVEHGTLRPLVRRGQFVGIVQKHDNSALLALIAQQTCAAARGRQAAESHSTKTPPECEAACPAPP